MGKAQFEVEAYIYDALVAPFIHHSRYLFTSMASSFPYCFPLFFLCFLSLSITVAPEPDYPVASKSLYQAHAWTMWLAFGFFFPIGIIIAKYGQKSDFKGHWFLLHWVLQMLGVILATVGLIIALSQFKALGHHTHTKLGFALALLIWLQPFFGVLRHSEGHKSHVRKAWFFLHWLFGTGAVILGWFNIFKGLDIYTAYWSDSEDMKPLYVGFSVQIALIGFCYLFLDRWRHLHRL